MAGVPARPMSSRSTWRDVMLLIGFLVGAALADTPDLSPAPVEHLTAASGNPGVIFEFPLAVDGQERHIQLKEGVPVAETVRLFIQEHRVDRSHEATIVHEIRRKMYEAGAEVTSRMHLEDQMDVFTMVVDTGLGRSENATFILDGREELQVLQYCSARQQGSGCVASILKAVAQHQEHRKMVRESGKYTSNSPAVVGEGVEGTGEPQLAFKLHVNGKPAMLRGYPGQSVSAVVEGFMHEYEIPEVFKKAITNEVVDAVLGLVDPKPLDISFTSDGTPLDVAPEGARPWASAVQPFPYPTATGPPSTSESGSRTMVDAEPESRLLGLRSDKNCTEQAAPTLNRPTLEEAQRKIYTVDMYVNKESRPLSVVAGQDLASVAREWCFEQGTQDPEHINFVQDVIEQSIREQDMRDQLSVYESRVSVDLLPSRPGDELFRFRPNGDYPPVVVHGGTNPMAIAEAWCREHNIRTSEVILVALLIVQNYDAWATAYQNHQPNHDATVDKDAGAKARPGSEWMPLVATIAVCGLLTPASLALRKRGART